MITNLTDLRLYINSLCYKFIETTKLEVCWYKDNGGVDFGDETQEYAIVSLSGGLNGKGNWLVYLNDLRELVARLQEKFVKVWIIDLDNDCADDVFYVRIGVRFVDKE